MTARPSSSRMGDKLIGTFAIEDEIGKGSFATVYRGFQRSTGALVAIKSVQLGKLNKKLKENLYSEIEILKGLEHPHIVALIDCRESTNHIHLVMEYCELGDLSLFIKKRNHLADNPALRDMVQKYPMPQAGGLNEVIVRHFLKQLASAMKFLRAGNFIHRDVKPQNLLLLSSPKYRRETAGLPSIMTASLEPLEPMVGLDSLPMLKIADFGFARSLPSTSLAETLCGSPLYMAPEILRYERYDAKADLWSIGTVLFEMSTGRPPFRAGNHVELLRKIEKADDHIPFPRDVVSPTLTRLIKGLLKRTPADRISFETMFSHPAVVEPIPNLVGDDRMAEVLPPRPEIVPVQEPAERSEQKQASVGERSPKPSDSPYSSSPRERTRDRAPSSPRTQYAEPTRRPLENSPRDAPQARPRSRDQRRPSLAPAATAPVVETLQNARPSTRHSPASNHETRRPSPHVSQDDTPRPQIPDAATQDAIDKAAQDVRDEREYVVIEKRQVEVNHLADEMAASPRLTGARQQTARAIPMTRRATVTSANTGNPPSPSLAVQIARPRPEPHQRKESLSYGSPTSMITKTLNNASMRIFGIGFSPHLIGKGASPPQIYNPFPTPQGQHALTDGRPNGPLDEDQRVMSIIEECATRSDVVFGFAEVKYKQLIPLAPSMDHGLGGPGRDGPQDEDDGLTVDAIVVLSEEALVLYVKALSLLAKCLDVAGSWWARKQRGEIVSSSHPPTRESNTNTLAGQRINGAVQWARNRFNEVLEKAEFVRLKLIEAQKQLPDDHPGNPKNHGVASRSSTASSTEGIVLSSGVTAEKLMYDRAIEMSRSAAINEIANDDLPGCEISYITAIRMLEAVLEDDEETVTRRKRSSSFRDGNRDGEETVNGINLDDRQEVQKVLTMVRGRLTTLRRKMDHLKQIPSPPRRHYSGHATPTAAHPASH